MHIHIICLYAYLLVPVSYAYVYVYGSCANTRRKLPLERVWLL
jgi:hypothetical protein